MGEGEALSSALHLGRGTWSPPGSGGGDGKTLEHPDFKLRTLQFLGLDGWSSDNQAGVRTHLLDFTACSPLAGKTHLHSSALE